MTVPRSAIGATGQHLQGMGSAQNAITDILLTERPAPLNPKGETLHREMVIR